MGRKAIEELSGGSLGPAPFIHDSWLWWNALRLSGLSQYWDEFSSMKNSGKSLEQCCRWLRRQVSEEEWLLLSRRLGKEEPLDPHSKSGLHATHTIWTKGGVWVRNGNFTKIIVTGEGLPPRPLDGQLQTALGHGGAEKLEREIYNLLDPNDDIVPECKRRAADYARYRLPELAGWLGTDRASWCNVSWFFQEKVLDHNNFIHDWKDGRGDGCRRPAYTNKRETDRWSW